MDEGQRNEKLGTDQSNYAHGFREVSYSVHVTSVLSEVPKANQMVQKHTLSSQSDGS